MDDMLDTEIETTIKPDGTVEVKLVNPSAEEMAQAAFLVAEKKLRALDGDSAAARTNMQYNAYRERLTRGKRLCRADA